MLQSYEDIKDKIDEEPKWYDEVGVPRYCEFDPDKVNDIYAKEVILVRIECQNCNQKFKVAMSQSSLQVNNFNSFKDKVDRCIHYGDPPRHGDHLGETMNCIDLEILEYYENSPNWDRKEEYETRLDKQEVV